MAEFILKHLFELLMTAAVAVMGAGYRLMLREIRQQKVERDAIKSLLRSNLIAMHSRYMAQHCIPIYAMETVQAMYHAYHTLGGNGTVTKLVDELMHLPTRGDERSTT